MKREIITIGFDKNGEADFGIRADIEQLSLEELKELREIIIVAIYIAEDMWRRSHPIPSGDKIGLSAKNLKSA